MRKNVKIAALSENEDDPFVVLLTPWSLTHFLSGCAAKQVHIPLSWWFMLHGAYEIKDQVVRETGEVYNSVVNSVGDQTCAVLGHILTPHVGASSIISKPFVLMFAAALTVGYLLEDVAPTLIG